MKYTRRIVLSAFGVGLLTPLIMLLYYNLTETGAGTLYVLLCPICIASMALDHASTSTAIVAWIVFRLVNGVLYSLPVLVVLGVVKADSGTMGQSSGE